MVLEDVYSRKSGPAGPRGRGAPADLGPQPIASPVDRAAALVADLVLFVPFAFLGFAPFRKQALVAQLNHDQDGWINAILLAGGVALLLFLAYQTVFLAWIGATPGKRFLGLRVVSVWDGKKPRPMDAFVRALVSVFELALLGIPWLAMYSNPKRRPFHDRVSDTMVVVEAKERAAGAPTLYETTVVSGINAAALSFVTLLTFISFHNFYRGDRGGSAVVQEMEAKNVLCPVVGEAQEDWGANDAPSRLVVALALHAAEAIDLDCLESEADFALWREQEKTFAYFAKSFSSESDPKTQKAYAVKTCESEPKGLACQILKLQENEELEPEAVVSLTPDTPLFVRLWTVRILMDQQRYDLALNELERLAPHRYFAYFFAQQRAKALWGLDRKDDARLAMRASIEGLRPLQRAEMARWFCMAETEAGCSDQARSSCEVFSAAVEKDSHLLETPDVAVAYIRGAECVSPGATDYARMSEKFRLKEARSLLKALDMAENNQTDEARRLLSEIKKSVADDNPFFFEAQTRLAELSSSIKDLEEIKESWRQAEVNEGWSRLGYLLFARFLAMGAYEKSLTVGLQLKENDPFNQSLQKSLVVSAYRAGDIKQAERLLQALQDEGDPAARAPASTTEFDRVVSDLKNKRGAGKP